MSRESDVADGRPGRGVKLARLYLRAFGAFRDRELEFSPAGDHDFHLIYGPNEAGKSTTLRAVTGFLFGIPERTGDAFLHEYGALRVGATVVLADGSRLSAMRRKARKATLFAIDETTGDEITDRPLPEATQADLVGGLDQALYRNLFGLDLDSLVGGGDELLRGEGEVGRSLFQAAAGLASLRSLIASLDDEAAASFKPRGSTGRLNRSLSEFDEQRRLFKEATVRTSAWESAEREYRQAREKHERLREGLNEQRARQRRLERIRANLPLLAERAAKRAEVQGLTHVPALAPEAATVRVAAQERLRAADEALRAAATRLNGLESDAAGLVVPAGVLERAGVIEQVFHAIGRYREARDALPALARERIEVSARIAGLLADIGVQDDVGSAVDGDPCAATGRAAGLLPPETLVARVRSLIEDHVRLTDRDEQLAAQVRIRQSALEGLKERLAALPESGPVDGLEDAVAGVANLPDLEARRDKLDRDIADADGRLQREAATLWPGPPSELFVLTVPLAGTATAFENDFAALAQDERLLADRDTMLARDLDDRRRELKVLAATGEVVTQAEVSTARADRDARWAALRHTRFGAAAVSGRAGVESLAGVGHPGTDGPESASHAATPTSASAVAPGVLAAFESAIHEADRLADLLRADTERATNLESTRQRIADMQAEIRRNEARRGRLAARRADLQARWEQTLAPLRRTDLSPAATREWLTRHQRLLDRHAALEGLRAERASVDAEFMRARGLLGSALTHCGLAAAGAEESATRLLARAQHTLDVARRGHADRESVGAQIRAASAELRDLRAQREQLAARLGEWQRLWGESAQGLQLGVQALPAEARARIDQFSRLSAALDTLRGVVAEEREQRSVVADFEAGVADAARAVALPFDGEVTDGVARQLYTALGEARVADARRQKLASDIERERHVRAEAQAAAEQARAVLGQLVRSAGCEHAEQLPEIEAQVATRRTLQQRLNEIDVQLVQLNAQAVDDVLREAGDTTLDRVVQQIDEIGASIEDLERQVEEARTVLFATQQRFDAIDGGTAAADAQQAARALAARITNEAHSFARTRLASAVLNRVVQRYREEHQGPLLRRAGEIFARITVGGFAGLTVDYDGDRQVLLGARPDGARVLVAGMSQGSRDQLFLALRLAAIEAHIAGRGPFPVIVDDLLVQFDDERAMATLAVLHELSARTQVLFFTHHRHLIDLAGDSPIAPGIVVHTL
ncbi:MAG: AAA family ATPase [Burkholderiaceae bacterium]